MIEIILFFIFGSLIGSFLNVCIVRLPQEKSIVFPSSHCVHCKKSIAWHDNIPIFSWIFLGGKCRNCRAKIASRYWIVEAVTGFAFACFYIYYGAVAVLPAYLIMLSCFLIATFVDLELRIIPDEISIGGMWAGLVLSALIPQLHPSTENLLLGGFLASILVLACVFLEWIYPVFCKHLISPEDKQYDDKPVKILLLISLFFIYLVNSNLIHGPAWLNPHLYSLACSMAGFIIGGAAIYMLGLIGDIIFRKESMGGGDVKLMAMIGAFLGWKVALLGFFVAPFFGGVIGIIEKIRTKDNTIAYGPFLVLGALISLFWGDSIIQWVLNGGIYHL